jgi:hypothetical protein
MAFNLASIRPTSARVALKMVVGGPNKIGKTTLAASAPGAVGILTEDGAHAVDTQAFPMVTSLNDVYESIGSLINEEHTFQTLFIDSLDWLEPLIHAHVCTRNGWRDIEAPGYGKGYVAAADEWRTLLAGLDAIRQARGMNIVLVVHDKIRRIDDPLNEPYDSHDLKLHDRASALIKEWADVLGFASYDLAIKETKGDFGKSERRALRATRRMLRVEPHPAHFGGNRYGLRDMDLTGAWENIQNQLAAIRGE